jgi:hypothetical protein
MLSRSIPVFILETMPIHRKYTIAIYAIFFCLSFRYSRIGRVKTFLGKENGGSEISFSTTMFRTLS